MDLVNGVGWVDLFGLVRVVVTRLVVVTMVMTTMIMVVAWVVRGRE